MADSNKWLETITEKENLEYEKCKLEGIVEELNRKLGLAKEALKFYADMHHLYENEWKPYCYIIQDESPDIDKPDFAELEDGGMVENGYKARKVLEEI